MKCAHKRLVVYRRQKFDGKRESNVAVTGPNPVVDWWEVYCFECKMKLNLGVKNLEK